MAEQDVFDALNDCIDRLNAGESIDACLQDYPQHAARLRHLLEVGDLVYRAQYPAAEVAAAQDKTRARLLQTMHSHRQEGKPVKPRKWIIPLMTAASLIVVLIGVILLSSSAYRAADIEISVKALTAAPTMLPDVGGPTAAVLDVTAMPSTTWRPEMTMTTGPALLPPVGGPTVTPANETGMAETAAAAISLTTTPMPGLLMGTPTPLSGSGGGGGGDIVPTSVYRLSPVPPTATIGGVAMLPSATAIGTQPPTGTPLPTQAALVTTHEPYLTPVQIIPLNAGEIDDNKDWDSYLLYRNNYLQQYPGTVHDVNVTGRQIIAVTDRQGLPVQGALVQVYAGQLLMSESRTYATGQTLFFPNAQPTSQNAQSFRVVIQKNGASAEFTLDPARGSAWNVRLDNAPPTQPQVKLDVLFLLDATGSMGDEIAQLQNNILGISAQIDALRIDVRYGLVTYRDRGDEFVTRPYGFTPDVALFQSNLNTVRADAGGDTPESLNAALHDAIHSVAWRGNDTVKLIFLVADAPPHLDYPDDYDYAQEMVEAARQGIKIHPIASSGLTQDGEFIFRQIAQYTMGHFIFLTYQQGASGAPGETRTDLHVGEPSKPQLQQQGDYTVERLDELVLRLIQDELAALRRPAGLPGGVEIPLMLGGGQGGTATPTVQGSGLTLPANLDVSSLLVIVGLSVLIGYSLKRGSVYIEKRKNDDLR